MKWVIFHQIYFRFNLSLILVFMLLALVLVFLEKKDSIISTEVFSENSGN